MNNSDVSAFLTNKMQSKIERLSKDLQGLRTGRVSVHLLDPIFVKLYNSNLPLSQVATISVVDSKTLSVQIWDKNNVKAVEKAIIEGNLGLNPITDDRVIRLVVPALSEERRKELVKIANRYGEEAKVDVRECRREGIDKLKKDKKDNLISEDQLHTISKEIQKLTDKYCSNIDDIMKRKEQEILSI